MSFYEDCKQKIRKELSADKSLEGKSDAEISEWIWDTVSMLAEGRAVAFAEKLKISEDLFSGIRGFGPLDRLISDDSVTEIMVNGPDRVYCERRGTVLREDCRFESEKDLLDIIQKIVGNAGREVNTANPIVDTRLPDGSRVCAVLPPVSLSGPALNIRKFPKEPMRFERLLAYCSVTEEAAAVLKTLVECGYNIFISGGTGSGKTSFLNALSAFIPADERLVTVEDSAELRIPGERNLVSMETRNANSAGNGRITVKELIRASLRMRPERIIVGEVRGAEALDMLQAMNTGHDGSLSTGHANSPKDMISRLETMVMEGAQGLPLEAVRRQIASSVDIIVHLSRMRDKSRKVVEITEIAGMDKGEIVLNPLFCFREEDTSAKTVNGVLVRTGNPLLHREKLEKKGRGDWIF